MLNTTGAFKVGDRVTGEFGTGKILHIHGKRATVEYGYGLKLQTKLCHLQHLKVGTSHFHQQEQFVEGEKCPSFSLTYAAESEQVSVLPDLSQEDSNLSASLKSTSTVATSSTNVSQESPTTVTCEVSTSMEDTSNPISSQLPQIVNPSQFKENDWELPTNEIVSQQSPKRSPDSNPNIGASRMLLDCSHALRTQDNPLGHIFEESSIKFMKAGTMQNGFVYPQDTLQRPSLENGYCWLDSPGALSSSTSRSPGQSKLEASLKSKGLLQKGEVLNPVFLCDSFSLPPTYLNPLELRTAAQLLEDSDKQREIFSIPESPPWASQGCCICPSCQQPLVSLDDGCGVCGWKRLPQSQSSTDFTHGQEISFDRERLRSAQRQSRSHGDEYSTSSNSTQKKFDCLYTPPHIVDLVLRVLGEIDLDPCADDGKHLRAKSHYTEAINGLEQEWLGRVFINPPYFCPDKWVAKLLAEYAHQRVVEAIALLPADTDSNWLNPVLKTQPVCFLLERIKFLDENYQPNVPAPQPYCLVYWGSNQEKFKEVFEAYGVVYLPITPSAQFRTYDQSEDKDLTAQISNSTPNRDDQEVLGENSSLLISPSTSVQGAEQVSEQSLLLTIPANTQVSSNSEVLGENLSLLISPSTSVQGDSQIPDSSLLTSIPSDTQVSNDRQVLGENTSPSISPNTYRKHGEGSGNLSWGYANANSTKKKPIKQLYFEWEYGRVRGKTYVRSHLRERIIELNEAKVPVTEILKLLSYNPKVAQLLRK